MPTFDYALLEDEETTVLLHEQPSNLARVLNGDIALLENIVGRQLGYCCS